MENNKLQVNLLPRVWIRYVDDIVGLKVQFLDIILYRTRIRRTKIHVANKITLILFLIEFYAALAISVEQNHVICFDS